MEENGMKLHEWACYIKADKFEEFLKTYTELGFANHPVIIYPKYVIRDTKDGKCLRVGISEPCVNVWDNEDKCGQREIWIWRGNFGYGNKKEVLPYIQDLIDAGFVECESSADRAD